MTRVTIPDESPHIYFDASRGDAIAKTTLQFSQSARPFSACGFLAQLYGGEIDPALAGPLHETQLADADLARVGILAPPPACDLEDTGHFVIAIGLDDRQMRHVWPRLLEA